MIEKMTRVHYCKSDKCTWGFCGIFWTLEMTMDFDYVTNIYAEIIGIIRWNMFKIEEFWIIFGNFHYRFHGILTCGHQLVARTVTRLTGVGAVNRCNQQMNYWWYINTMVRIWYCLHFICVRQFRWQIAGLCDETIHLSWKLAVLHNLNVATVREGSTRRCIEMYIPLSFLLSNWKSTANSCYILWYTTRSVYLLSIFSSAATYGLWLSQEIESRISICKSPKNYHVNSDLVLQRNDRQYESIAVLCQHVSVNFDEVT